MQLRQLGPEVRLLQFRPLCSSGSTTAATPQAGTGGPDAASARQSIAADGGAAEVYRISPDEPWRYHPHAVAHRRVVEGAVEGGGRVSGYFTGCHRHTDVYRGRRTTAPAFERQHLQPRTQAEQLSPPQSASPRTAVEPDRPPRRTTSRTIEFAASNDTWVRVVNFANAPDGCLHVIDMYREVIEHPWSIPEEIEQSPRPQQLATTVAASTASCRTLRPGSAANRVALGSASTAELVATLAHPNGWHRDTASRLLYERQDAAAAPLLAQLARDSKSPLARHHALGALDGLGRLDEAVVTHALADTDAHVRELGRRSRRKAVHQAIRVIEPRTTGRSLGRRRG
jgi:hypothetical protein